MKAINQLLCTTLLVACSPLAIFAQPATRATTAVPRLVKFSGALTDNAGKPLTGVVGLTFALYETQEGGAPIWMETQNIEADNNGQYTALLGATKNEGIPAEIFGSGERWLGVQPQGQTERPRVLMTSVPYSLKAVDAETLGGLPASAYALAGTAGIAAGATGGAVASVSARVAAPAGKSNSADTAPATTITGSGTAGTLALWTSSSVLASSVIEQKSGLVGIGITPGDFKLSVADSTASGIAGLTSFDTGVGVEGIASADTGANVGVYGSSSSSEGIGVTGDASATSGNASGIFGTTASTDGIGVSGSATATTGTTNGVFGTADSGTGIGVFGSASATSGENTGVYGTTASPDGNGMQGDANAETGNTSGVYGTNVSTEGTGIEGDATATSGDTVGVFGQADSSTGYGVEGSATADSGTTIGVYGKDASTTGFGVEGQATSTTGNNVGVYGKSVSTSGIGVSGNVTATSGVVFGVFGNTASPGGYGVEGTATATSGETYAVAGINSSSAGYGVYGYNESATGATFGVFGEAASTAGIGVVGVGTAESELGKELNIVPAGVWGTSSAGVGVLATTDGTEAIAAYNNASNVATLFVENQEDNTDSSIVVATYSSYGGFCDIFVNGNLTCSGSVGGHAVLPNGSDGKRDVALYAVQSPENWFEDMGGGQLHNGSTVVTLDADYAQTVNTGMEYRVFLTPNGDSKGLYVTNKTATSFEVHEQGGGTSSIAFDYRIVARRKGYENVRMADLAGKIQKGPSLHAGNPAQLAEARPHPTAAPVMPDNGRPRAAKAVHHHRAPAHAAKPVRATKPVHTAMAAASLVAR
jgi:hypothetical protein